MLPPMSAPLLLALIAFAVALVQRWRQAHGGRFELEALVLTAAIGLGAVGLLATGLAMAGRFSEWPMVVGVVVLAGASWPWRGGKPVGRPLAQPPRWRLLLALAVLTLGIGLRLPSIPAPLAGRDQGTYALRALHTLRTGSLGHTDALLAAETAAAAERSGAADILGLYPRSDEQWRRGVYETSYRPGLYLTDRDAGTVVPQFMHLHPMLMATSGLALGPAYTTAVVLFEALLGLLGLYAVARRLWPRGAWSELALGLAACSPLLIWVHRVPLTETLTMALTLAAVLAVMRARDGEPAQLVRAAALFGLTAWVRGNAWITAPVVIAILLLRPRVFRPGRGALLTLSFCVLASVVVHALTAFPYLYDEFHRLLPSAEGFGSETIVGTAILLVLIVIGTDLGMMLGLRRPPRSFLRWLGHAPKGLCALAVGAAGAYLWLESTSPPKPYSRLDPVVPLLGWPLIVMAGLGLVVAALRWRPRWRQADLWLLALAAVPVLTLMLYARRNLPQLGLYYYGRYLVPELLPAAILLGVTALAAAADRLSVLTSRRIAVGASLGAALGLLGSTGAVLVTQPQTRLREFEQAEQAVEWLLERTEPDAIVVAGGEGWHHGHTYNQVGGALALGHGRHILPYRNREAAYRTLYELLIARPEATGVPAPPVYLLLNEASHNYTREDGRIVAGLDDGLAPPFTVADVALLELFTHRLTPVTDALPVRVTRDVLRMGLLRVEVAPMDPSRTWDLTGATTKELASAGLAIKNGARAGERWCLHPKKATTLRLDPVASANGGSLVLVAEPGTARRNDEWDIRIDGERVANRMPRSGRVERDTLGPFLRGQVPKKIEIRGSPHPIESADCPNGGLARVRWVQPERSWLAASPDAEGVTIAPPDDLGRPVTPTAWVSARALNRYRPGTEPDPKVEARSLVVSPRSPLKFSPIQRPGANGPVDVVVTLTGTSLSPDAKLSLLIDDREIAQFDPPDERSNSWQTDVVRLENPAPMLRVRLELIGEGDPDHYVRVRDVAFFGIQAERSSTVQP